MVDATRLEQLKATLRGRVIERGDDDYADACKLYNAMIEKRPLLIARCLNAADVMTAVNFGRDNDLLMAIRGGGHNGPGFGTCDDGLVIDLLPMKGVRVDPSNRTVRAEPGCTQGDVDHATHPFGLAVPAGIVSTTGIAGLTLGGGHGYLSRKYGLTIDNLLEADVVLADGSFVTASETQNPDLFWALRGGGGNFGVVTSFCFRAHPVDSVYGGPIFWALDDAGDVMRHYREFLPKAPEDLCSFFGLKKVPSTEPFPEELWGRRICALVSCYNGTASDGEAALKPLLDALPEPLMNGMTEMPFPALQALFDPLLPPGLQWYWKGDFVGSLTDEAIEAHLEHGGNTPSELSLMHLYPINGAVHRVDPGATAWRCRDANWSMVIAGIDPDPRKAEDLKRWGRNYWEAVHPFNPGGGYVNFMMEDEESNRIENTYGENHARLVEVKRKYDPQNLFRVNQNIAPDAA